MHRPRNSVDYYTHIAPRINNDEGQAMDRIAAHQMIKRRAKAAGLPREITCHSLRATGITDA